MPHFNFTVKIPRQDLDPAFFFFFFNEVRDCMFKKKLLETHGVFFKKEAFFKDGRMREIPISPPTPHKFLHFNSKFVCFIF